MKKMICAGPEAALSLWLSLYKKESMLHLMLLYEYYSGILKFFFENEDIMKQNRFTAS